jgi:predicted TIM-barrel enzyme
MRGDAVIVTGSVTGDAPRATDVNAVKAKCHLPVYLGSGVTTQNLRQFYRAADGFIIGSHFKTGGNWAGAVDKKRVETFMAAHRKLGG